MDLPVEPPIEPMLGKLARQLPRDGYVYEPKWDGFRCLAFRDRDEVELRSRNDRPLARYFPELVNGLRRLGGERFVLDGEIVVAKDGRLDFTALMARLHPAASRAALLALETPARYVGFDLLAVGAESLLERHFAERRRRLDRLLARAAPPIHRTPATKEPAVAEGWIERYQGAGIDGVIAKRPELPYRPGGRTMVKVKREQTADCVVAGLRLYAGEPMVGSLLLGVYDESHRLRHVGVATSFSDRRRRELLAELEPLARSLAGHPWEHGWLPEGGHTGRLGGAAGRWIPGEMALDWLPLAPLRVAEVAYDQLDGFRFRHPARFRRWRPDREPKSCTLEQLVPHGDDPTRLLAA